MTLTIKSCELEHLDLFLSLCDMKVTEKGTAVFILTCNVIVGSVSSIAALHW